VSILALDLATLTGWAAETNGVRESGVVECSAHKGETKGWRFVRFNVWLYGWKDLGLKLVVYEHPHHRGGAATECAYGLSTRVEEFCSRHYIRCESVHTATLKKHATGHGHATKDMMVKMAQVLKPGVSDDNESDALWLLDYAKSHILRSDSKCHESSRLLIGAR
jgi:hypothetical protein